MPREKRRDYEVGYRKLPHHTQFKKGQSGNPRGRPCGSQLTTSLTIASRLVILRRLLFSVMVTSSLSTSFTSVFRFFDPHGRPRGLPD